MGLGNRLKAILDEKEVRVATLAADLGLNKTTLYSLIQRDSDKMDMNTLARIADYLNVPLDYFTEKGTSANQPSIGQRIKEMRMARGMTQEQLAKALHVTNGAVGNYEADMNIPKCDILCRIMEVLECDANYLYQDLVNPSVFSSYTCEQIALIDKYNDLDAYGRQVVNAVLGLEHARCKAQEGADHDTK